MVHAGRLHDGRHAVCSGRHMCGQADPLYWVILLILDAFLRRDFFLSRGSNGVQGLRLEPTHTMHGLESTSTHGAGLSLPECRIVVHHLVPSAWSVELLSIELRCYYSLGARRDSLVNALEPCFIDAVVRL